MTLSIGNTPSTSHPSTPELEEFNPERYRELLYAGWDSWKQKAEEGERRDVAVERMKSCVEGFEPETLDLSALNLRTLPDYLPDSVYVLNVANNNLTHLPSELPSDLKQFYVNDNQLVELPNFPDSLEGFYARFNQLRSLPPAFPSVLYYLDAGDNLLASFPDGILTMPPNSLINLANNPFPDKALDDMEQRNNATNRVGPKVVYKDSLEKAITFWYPAHLHFETTRNWLEIETKKDSLMFFDFLNRLSETSIVNDPDSREYVIDYLSRMYESPSLRRDVFSITQNSSEAYNDLVAMKFIGIQKSYSDNDIQNGHYDAQLEKLISLAKDIFRQDGFSGIPQSGENTFCLQYPGKEEKNSAN